MMRPKVYEEERVATAIRLPVSLREELQRAAFARDVSVNYLVTKAISDLLERLPGPDLDGRDGGRTRKRGRGR
ncbi:MAG TPA: hypothetical protein VEJ87_12165 [Acidimicrobiales bacterium]|nr:hypothetical protein [Acidimicrobiales bacterium]